MSDVNLPEAGYAKVKSPQKTGVWRQTSYITVCVRDGVATVYVSATEPTTIIRAETFPSGEFEPFRVWMVPVQLKTGESKKLEFCEVSRGIGGFADKNGGRFVDVVLTSEFGR